MKHPRLSLVLSLAVITGAVAGFAQTPDVPDWALPGSAKHKQVPPPVGFHRATKTFDTPIGVFDGQSDIGGPLVPGDASYDAATQRYTIDSAGYNIWYNRDEFRYLWKKMSGDVSLAATITFPKPGGYDDRKVVLIVRQDLNDDAKEVMTALHGGGLIHLAFRPETNADIKEQFRIKPQAKADAHGVPTRLGIEKHGDTFTLYVSQNGEPMHKAGTTASVHFDEPFYVGIGFTSHLPATVDTAVVSDVALENTAGQAK